MKLSILRLFCLLSALMNFAYCSSVPQNEEYEYFPRGLVLYSESGSMRINFYDSADEEYSAAVVYSSSVDGILAPHFSKDEHDEYRERFTCYIPNERNKFQPTEEYSLMSAGSNFSVTEHYHKTSYDRGSFHQLIQDINSAETVIISFGAGISQGYVPTLEEFYEALGVKKAFSKSSITDQSFVSFAKELITNHKQTTKKVRKVWDDVMSCDHQSTPSHELLLRIIYILRNSGKLVLPYTDNIDGIDDAVGIGAYDNNYEMCPSTNISKVDDKISKSNVVMLVCGQSFDFQSYITSVTKINPDTKFYSLNTKGDKICRRDNETTIEMQWIEGTLHETYSQIYFRLMYPTSVNGLSRTLSVDELFRLPSPYDLFVVIPEWLKRMLTQQRAKQENGYGPFAIVLYRAHNSLGI